MDMRGIDKQQGVVFSYINPEQRVPLNHPLRRIRGLVDGALTDISVYFDGLYARRGRRSIPPEQLLRALLLQVLYSIRSERQLMEQVEFNVLFRWFVGLNMDDEVWDVTVYTKNRKRMMNGQVSQRLLEAVVERARQENLLSEDHFTVDGTLIQAWAGKASFKAKDPATVKGTGNRGRKLLRDTHESQTDPEARLYSKGGAAIPCFIGHVVSENRHGLVIAACATTASKTAETEAGLEMLKAKAGKAEEEQPEGSTEEGPDGKMPDKTVGADKAYQNQAFVEGVRKLKLVPHVAEYEPNPQWPNWLTEAERQHPGFGISQGKRKLIEKVFGWGKQGRAVKQIKLRGQKQVDWMFRFIMATQNMVRMVKLIPHASPASVSLQ
jgi:transposase